MGLDLAIYPIKHHQQDWWLGSSTIQMDREYDLFSQLGVNYHGEDNPIIDTMALPEAKDFQVFSEDGIEKIRDDCYGTALRWSTAGNIAEECKAESTWNRGVLAFLAAIPADTPIVLYWH